MKINQYIIGALAAFAMITVITLSSAAPIVVTGDNLKIGSPHDLRTDGAANSIAGGALNTNYSTTSSTIAGGNNNMILTNLVSTNLYSSFIGAGSENVIQGDRSFIGGGQGNKIFTTNGLPGGQNETQYGVIVGGIGNILLSFSSVIGGGYFNFLDAAANFSVIAGGNGNVITYNSAYSVISGGTANIIEDGAWWGAINGGRGNEIEGSGEGTNSSGYFAHFGWIGGGEYNYIDRFGRYGSIGGGQFNSVEGELATLGGGQYNTNAALWGTIAGGLKNIVQTNAQVSAIGGGWANTIKTNAFICVIGGGEGNVIENATNATIGGGLLNTIKSGSQFSTIPGGGFNNTAGNASFAAGWRAKATNDGAFVWSDYNGSDFSSTAANQFRVRASGGVYLYTDSALTTGQYMAAGSGSWSSASDRNIKENFKQAKPREVLEKLAALPINTWNYKTQDADIRHIGPTAQDFRKAFGVGEDEKHITSVDADGVALAAIQGLYEMLREKDTQLKELQKELQAMKKRLDR